MSTEIEIFNSHPAGSPKRKTVLIELSRRGYSLKFDQYGIFMPNRNPEKRNFFVLASSNIILKNGYGNPICKIPIGKIKYLRKWEQEDMVLIADL